MIKIPQLTEKDLEIYRGKKIFIPSIHERSLQLYQIFKFFRLDVVFLNDRKNGRKFNELEILGLCLGIKTIKPAQLPNLFEKYDNLILQTIELDNASTKLVAKTYPIEVSPYSFGEITMSFSHLTLFKLLANPITYHACALFWKIRQKNQGKMLWERNNLEFQNTPILICSPPKTADVSLLFTFRELNRKISAERLGCARIESFNLWHKPRMFNRRAYAQKYKK